jgi:hypothetical protein
MIISSREKWKANRLVPRVMGEENDFDEMISSIILI